MDVNKIISENLKRNAQMDALFDPMTGEGSLIPRTFISYSDSGKIISYYCPDTMAELPVIKSLVEMGSVEVFIQDCLGGYSPDKHIMFSKELLDLRLDHDFEFYCYTCVKIPDKESEDLIPFKLNRSQRKLISRYEKMRVANKPIRLVLDKARQWGGSTGTQIYMNWIQIRHKMRWNMAVCTLVNAQASHIRNMFERTIDNYPEFLGKYTFANYAGTTTIKTVLERDCIVGVGSTQAPENLRTFSIHMLHGSEVGSWEDTPKRSAKSLMQSLRGTIKNMPYTMVVLESTAKGLNFFYDEWRAAVNKESGYDALFIPWWEIEMYREPIKDMNEFIASLDEKYSDDGKTFWYLWELGATLEGINWYKNHKKRERMDDISMFQEFPSTAEESFSSTGRPAFNHIHIKNMEKSCEPPLWVGELVADDVKGKKAFKNLRFEERRDGRLHIWAMPDKDSKISHRYCSFADIGGKHYKSDKSVLKLLDRYWMIEGGVPEVCAMWHGNIDQDLFAWKAAQISFFWNKALMAVETNSLDKDEESEGDHFLTVLDEIAPFYPNLYSRTDPEQIRKGMPSLWGFHTNRKTKPMLIDTQNAALRDNLYIEKDIESIKEMYLYEVKDNGSYGAKEGGNDDRVIVTAGANWLALKYMPLPMEIKPDNSIRRKPIISDMTF